MFEQSRLKLQRAKKHIEDFNSLIDAFHDSKPSRMWIEKDGQRAQLWCAIEREFPEEGALIIGDAVHNMRAALDIMACDLVRNSGEDAGRHTTFPILQTRQAVEARIKGGQLRHLSARMKDFILDGIKPYEGGNDALFTLNELDLMDKHRLLIPQMQLGVIHGVRLRDGHGNVFENAMFTMSGTRGHAAVSGSPDMQIMDEGDVSIGIFFDNGTPLEAEPVAPFLLQLRHDVLEVIKVVERVATT